MMMVVSLVILAIILATACVGAVWPRPAETPGAARREESEDAPTGRDPESLEGVLVRKLMSGVVDRAQYLRTMTRLAEREAARRPFEAPHD